MKARRKTLPINDLVSRVNDFLSATPDHMKEARLAVATVLAGALMEADAYWGYGFTQLKDIPTSEFEAFMASDKFDSSRREYR